MSILFIVTIAAFFALKLSSHPLYIGSVELVLCYISWYCQVQRWVSEVCQVFIIMFFSDLCLLPKLLRSRYFLAASQTHLHPPSSYQKSSRHLTPTGVTLIKNSSAPLQVHLIASVCTMFPLLIIFLTDCGEISAYISVGLPPIYQVLSAPFIVLRVLHFLHATLLQSTSQNI